jgi:FkbM family methyltransferase
MHATLDINPAMTVDVFYGGIAPHAGHSKVQITMAGRNFGSTHMLPVEDFINEEERFRKNTMLQLYTLDSLVNDRRTSLVKIDCEGCEWDSLRGGRRTLERAPMLKMEFNLAAWTNSTDPKTGRPLTTVSPKHILRYLEKFDYEFFYEPWSESGMGVYFGLNKDKRWLIDEAFGTMRLDPPTAFDAKKVHLAAVEILQQQFTPNTFALPKLSTDIICIKRGLAEAMKKRFLGGAVASTDTGTGTGTAAEKRVLR